HRAADGAAAQSLPRPLDHLPPLLRAQGDAGEVLLRVRGAARGLRDPRRDVRGGHAGADREGQGVPDRAPGPGVLAAAHRLRAQPAHGGGHHRSRRCPDPLHHRFGRGGGGARRGRRDAPLRPRLRDAPAPALVPGRVVLTLRGALASVAAPPPTPNGRSSMHMASSLRFIVALLLALGAVGGPTAALAQAPIKIGLVQGFTGALEVYAKQAKRGFDLGLEYATKGKKEVLGRKSEVIEEDDQLKPDVAKQKVTKLFADDKVDLVVGTTSSAAALAVLPVAAEFKKILIVETRSRTGSPPRTVTSTSSAPGATRPRTPSPTRSRWPG